MSTQAPLTAGASKPLKSGTRRNVGLAVLNGGIHAIPCNLLRSGNETAAIGVLIAGAANISWD